MLPISVVIFLLAIISKIASHQIDPDEDLTVPQLIESRGYKAETHKLILSDGYILGIHRIVNRIKCEKYRCRPILLWHGLISSSADFIINSPGGGLIWTDVYDYEKKKFVKRLKIGNNLGFVLADLGYDVWLGNSRGNLYSTMHTKLDPFKGREYWDFSFQEMAEVDLPETVDYIRKLSRYDQVAYIGHSQGTIIGFWLLARRHEYTEILKPVIMLAPVVDGHGVRLPLRWILEKHTLDKVFEEKGGPLLPHSTLFNLLGNHVCADPMYQYLCENAISMLGGFDFTQRNFSRLPVYVKHSPAGTSVKDVLHAVQLANGGNLCYFDYGAEKNSKMYNSNQPPMVNISQIVSPHLTIFSASNDLFVPAETIEVLKRDLRVPFAVYNVQFDTWSHLDYLWAKQLGYYVISKIIEVLKEYHGLKLTVY